MITGAALRKYLRGAKGNPDVINVLFDKLPTRKELAVSWISAFKFHGGDFITGKSWILATHRGTQFFGAIPESGAFWYNDRYYATIHVYPYGYDDSLGLLTCTVPLSFTPEIVTIALGSHTESAISLWPSSRRVSDDSATYRFVQL